MIQMNGKQNNNKWDVEVVEPANLTVAKVTEVAAREVVTV
jgi:hypothetical protein